MFFNDLYTTGPVEISESKLSTEITINPEHRIFEGHFPEAPVMPGVVQLQIVKEILEMHLDKPLRMKKLHSCKFLSIINPLETSQVSIDAKFTTSEYLDVVTSIRHNETVYLKAQVSYLQ
jgi:3-hydroxyacyl-[acyl-carrier-protein] dehydratase